MLDAWRLKDFDPGEGTRARAFASETKEADWLPIAAPGDVYVALTKAGRITDPFKDQNERDCAWVMDREWWQRTSFTAPSVSAGARLVLTFQGLDTYATIYLNGDEIAVSENMFRPLELDITDRVRAGENTLAIRFDPPALHVKDKAPLGYPGVADAVDKTKRNYIRKAQFGWGWDWGPTLPTVGIWRPVELKVRSIAALDEVHCATLSLSKDRKEARIAISATAARVTKDDLTLRATLTDPSGAVVLDETRPLSGDAARIEATLANPALWWTHDLGKPALHTLRVELSAGGKVLETREQRVGIRTIELDRSPDAEEPGTEFFRFILNGAPIFARGACWIPASSYVGALTEADYRPLIESAADGNMNMLRIWGGGIYEHEAFYDLCDELGVVVWQDFMMACAAYPEDEAAFVDSVRAEVRAQVKALRHHPSIALWCGNNECQMIHDLVRNGADIGKLAGTLYYDEVMPDAVAELDPTTPYWPGSPFGGPHANSMRAGDVHNWTVWHGMPPIPDDKPVGKFGRTPENINYMRYAEDMSRFVSEYGIHASPALETLRRCMAEDQLHYGSEGLLHRIKDHPKDKVNGLLVTVTGIPETIQQYVDFTQITQAEGLKFGIEHFRRRMPHCSGSLIWQFNDCWPCTSWSLVDYHNVAKAGFYYARRAYAPVIATFKLLDNGDVELWLTNERQTPVQGEVTIEAGDFHTGALWSEKLTLDAPAYSSAAIWKGDAAKIAASPKRYLNVRAGGDFFPENRLFFAAIKDLDRPRDAAPKASFAQRSPTELAVTIEAPSYLYFTHLIAPDPRTHFSDNHFDLRAGQKREIIVTNPGGITPADVTVRSV